jgi:hypothetical protein
VLYKMNEPDVVSESFEDELVLVNLATGTYFAARGGGTVIWDALINGADNAQIETALAESPEHLEAARSFLRELVENKLVSETPSEPQSESRADLSNLAGLSPAVLERYSDMQDLLMLDPVHEVDEQGWPTAKNG